MPLDPSAIETPPLVPSIVSVRSRPLGGGGVEPVEGDILMTQTAVSTCGLGIDQSGQSRHDILTAPLSRTCPEPNSCLGNQNPFCNLGQLNTWFSERYVPNLGLEECHPYKKLTNCFIIGRYRNIVVIRT